MSAREEEPGGAAGGEALTPFADIAARSYLDLADVIFIALDAEARVLLINRTGCEILGYSQDEILGKPWIDAFLPERFHAQMKPLFYELIGGGRLDAIDRHENPVVTKSGEERLIEWHNALLRDEGGAVRALMS